MTFKSNDYNQTDLLNDSYLNTSKRAQNWLKKTWAEPFREMIFPAINEERFKVLYNEENGRPPTPINYVFGALIIKEIQSLTDEDLKLRCHTDLSIQHALHSTSWKEQPVSDRTFSRFRERCYLYELKTGVDLIQEHHHRQPKDGTQWFHNVYYSRCFLVRRRCQNASNQYQQRVLFVDGQNANHH